MGFVNFLRRFRRLNNRPSLEKNSVEAILPTSEYVKAQAFNKTFADLLAQDKFIARSDYKALIETYRDVWQLLRPWKNPPSWRNMWQSMGLTICR